VMPVEQSTTSFVGFAIIIFLFFCYRILFNPELAELLIANCDIPLE
jgi:hypothetical protein